MPYGEALERQAQFLKLARRPESAKRFGGEFRRLHAITALTYGMPYFWERGICDLIVPAIEALREPWTLERESLPAPQGFFWFEKSPSFLQFTEMGDKPIKLRGFSWTIYYLNPGEPIRLPGGIVQPILHPELPKSGGGNMERAGGVAITYFSEYEGKLIPFGDSMWRFGRTHMELAENEAIDSGWTKTDAFDGGGRDNAAVVTCWEFIQHKILEMSTGMRVDRATARRVERENVALDPIVSVIRLRRKHYVGYEPPDIDSGRRMGVRSITAGPNGTGFWRPFYCPSRGFPVGDKRAYQPRWVMPFWRGPEDAPIKIGRLKVGLVDT